MKEKNLFILSTFCTYLCFLGFILLFKKPICINSSVVEKLDVITSVAALRTNLIDSVMSSNDQSAYNCELNRSVPYSNKLIKTEAVVSEKLNNLILFLNSIQKFKNKIHLIINERQPLLFEIKNSQFQIGVSLLNAEGHLERGLIKIWIRENLNADSGRYFLSQIENSVFEEVLTDFIYYVAFGSLNIEDPLTGIKTKIGSAKWPQVLKKSQSYCDSSWKASEHFKICGQLDLIFQDSLENQMMTLSLRPLLSSSFIQAYKNLTRLNQINLINHIDDFLKNRTLNSDQQISMIIEESNPLKKGIHSVKNFSELFISSALATKQEFKQLYAGLTSELQNSGFSDSFAEAYFDYIIEIPDRVLVQSIFFKNLELASKNNLNLQIAIKDQNQIWIMPSKTALPLTSFDRIKSRQSIYFACSNLKEVTLESFFNLTEKLLLIRGCDQSKDYHFSKLFESGIKEFIKKNDKIKFVQFHIPSVEMKQKELAHVNNFFELVENRDMNRPEFKTLGWMQIQWADDVFAYKPQAQVEAIEYFRN